MVKKIVLGFVVLLLLLVATVIAVPFIFKDKINAKVKDEINRQLNAKVEYGDFSLSLIRSFPNFSFSLNELSIIGIKDFEGDTLTHIKQLSFTIDLMSVINGSTYKVLAVELNEPFVHGIVNYSGKKNWDITKSTASTSSSPFSIQLKKSSITDGTVWYEDKPGNLSAKATQLNFEGSGNITQDLYDLATKTNIGELTIKSGGINYLSKAKVEATVNMGIDNINNKYTFKENNISVNALQLAFDGFIQSKKNELVTDIKFKSPQTDFKNILSLVPVVYKTDFEKVSASGSLALDGFVKGNYTDKTYPAFKLNLEVNNGKFKYPTLPLAVSNVNIAALFTKPQGGLDATLIDINKLHAEIGTDAIDARVAIQTPVSNPNVRADIKAKVDLANVLKLVPMEDVRSLSGLLKLDLNFKGKQSDIDAKNYEAIIADGNASVTNLIYDSKEAPMPVKVSNMQMQFTPRNLVLNAFAAKIGKSDINATGTLDNFMSYAFGKGDLLGNLKLNCGVFDANEWLQKDKVSATNTSKTEYFKVPAHIDFTATANFGRIYYEKLLLNNVHGNVLVRDESIRLSDLYADVLGGNATLEVIYNTKNKDYPDVSFTYDINNFDIQQTYNLVGMAPKMAPVIKYLQGTFSSDMKGAGKLNRDMSVDYSSLTGDGKIEIPSAKIVGLPILTEVTKLAKIPALQNLEIKDGWTLLKFKNGKVNIDPTDIKFGNGYNINLKGANGFDQSIDYNFRLDVPSKELGPAASVAQNMLAKVPGAGATLPEVVGFVFNATGTAEKPQVKLTKVLAGGSSVKDVVNNAIDDAKQKAEEEARKQAEEIKQKAEAELQKQKQAAEQAVQKAKEEAERKAREAAEKAKKEAEQKVKDLIKFPKK